MGLLEREDVIHFSIRRYLRKSGWTLVAGEYPNGSDDELHSLRILDPVFARDQSPDHRRHSLNKLVPDLIAFKANEFLVIEMKPRYSKADEQKLIELLGTRRDDLIRYLQEFTNRYMIALEVSFEHCHLTPALGFAAASRYSARAGFVYLTVSSLDTVTCTRA